MNLKAKVTALAAVLVLTASSALAGHHNEKSNTIVDVASSADQFSTLVTALQAASLVETLQGSGPFTVFAPTNEAFEALPEGALASLLADPDQLAAVLTLHVVAGEAKAADVVNLANVTTVQGKVLAIDTSNGVSVGGANVIQADVEASNGVIHVIDRVLLP
jgi:transforming growth factor-beta-induced protein